MSGDGREPDGPSSLLLTVQYLRLTWLASCLLSCYFGILRDREECSMAFELSFRPLFFPVVLCFGGSFYDS